ncbi:MAG: hypothetical protein [Podoviridae sp. ctDWo9]|nr:MAG: hypothetical protein [Podoviridae sp. ctDWo9]
MSGWWRNSPKPPQPLVGGSHRYSVTDDGQNPTTTEREREMPITKSDNLWRNLRRKLLSAGCGVKHFNLARSADRALGKAFGIWDDISEMYAVALDALAPTAVINALAMRESAARGNLTRALARVEATMLALPDALGESAHYANDVGDMVAKRIAHARLYMGVGQ